MIVEIATLVSIGANAAIWHRLGTVEQKVESAIQYYLGGKPNGSRSKPKD